MSYRRSSLALKMHDITLVDGTCCSRWAAMLICFLALRTTVRLLSLIPDDLISYKFSTYFIAKVSISFSRLLDPKLK